MLAKEEVVGHVTYVDTGTVDSSTSGFPHVIGAFQCRLYPY